MIERLTRGGSSMGVAARIGIVWASLVLVWVGAGLFRAEILAPRLPFDAWRMIESLISSAFGAEILENLETVEPRLRRAASFEVDTRAPVDDVVAMILDRVGR
jgi:hypothetical protein